MTKHVEELYWEIGRWLRGDTMNSGTSPRWLSGGEDDGHSDFGVHIEFEDLYHSVVFLATIYVAGQVASRLLKMPSLVGEIFTGILLGPPLADFVPNAEAWVLLGEIGLILLVLEAGIDIDLTTLKLIGGRGIMIAIVGSILPIAIGVGIAFALGGDTKQSLAAGACFGPTSLGIAMNILRAGKIVNTPVGQLIVSAAVIDDMIALIILSQLEALAGEITAAGVLIPIVSALAFLILGGYAAVFIIPDILNKILSRYLAAENRARAELGIMLAMLLGLMPATYYAKASFLVGAFLSGLTFCRSHDLHALFVSQFKRILHWLMSIFFAASIGFQVPIKDFGDGKVIGYGFIFTLALLGKLAVGFMVPNFNHTKKYTGLHFRDVLVTGFSMAAEGEFAFVIAVFGVSEGLITESIYASIVFAVLLSTIIPPFCLRFTISYYNKKSEQMVRKAAEEELKRQMDGKKPGLDSVSEALEAGIKTGTTFFMCIQTQSESSWGLLPNLMGAMNKQNLEIIDHRSWHARGVDSTLINEVYARDLKTDVVSPEERMDEVKAAIEKVINQPDVAKVKVQRWYPGVVEEIVEEVHKGRTRSVSSRRLTADKILKEAQSELEKKRTMQTSCTTEKTVDEILNESTALPELHQAPTEEAIGARRRPRRVRQKMRSTPVVGGDMFGTSTPTHYKKPARNDLASGKGGLKKQDGGVLGRAGGLTMFEASGTPAELVIDGESFKVRISAETMRKIRGGYSGTRVDDGGISISSAVPPVNYRLQGFVRNFDPLGEIAEETEGQSEISDSEHH